MTAFRTLRLALLLGAALTGPAAAQIGDIYDLEGRLQRIESDLRVVQAQAQGLPPGGFAEPGAPSRVGDIERSLRDLTGQVETLSNDVRQLKDRLERLETETNFRLNQLEGNPGGGAAVAGDAPADAPAPDEQATTAGPDAGAAPAEGEPRPPGTLGQVGPTPPGTDAEAAYDAAMDLLTEQRFDEAQGAFRSIVETWPDSDFAAQSQYWIADIHYVRKDYEQSARAFAEVLKAYPQAGRGPEAMLKLGLSLNQIGKTDQGCATLAAISKQYPGASDALLARAEREARKAGCG